MNRLTDTPRTVGEGLAPSRRPAEADRFREGASPSPTVLQVAMVTFLVAAAAFADWPTFRGDAGLTGVAETLDGNLEVAWTFEADDSIESTAAIVGDSVFVASLDGKLYALELGAGELRWTYEASDEVKSSPSVHDGVVYLGDEAGVFHAIDAKTGTAKWTYQTDAGIISSANFVNDKVVFGSYDNHLYALKITDGSLAWKLETDNYVHASPGVASGFTYFAGCDGLFRQVQLSDGSEVSTVQLDGYVAGSAALLGNRAFVGTFENTVLGIDVEDSKILWRYKHSDREFPFYSSPAVTSEVVVIGGRDKLVHAIDAKTGEGLWTYTTKARIDSSPVISGNRVFIAGNDGDILGLDLSTGEVDWQFESGSSISASAAISDGRMILGTLDGLLYAFKAKEAL